MASSVNAASEGARKTCGGVVSGYSTVTRFVTVLANEARQEHHLKVHMADERAELSGGAEL